VRLTHKFYGGVPKTQHADISVRVQVNGPVTTYIQSENASPLKSYGTQAGTKKLRFLTETRDPLVCL